MRKIFLFIIALYCSSIVLAQNTVTDTSATCVAYWQKGAVKTFSITHRKEKQQAGKPVTQSVVSYDAYLRIIDSTQAGYTIEWTQQNYRSEGVDPQTMALTNSLMQGLKIIYKTDDIGTFKELVNWKSIRDFWIGKMEASVDKSDKNAVEAMKKTKALFQSKESLEAVLIREIRLYHMPYGVEYTYKGQQVEILLPNITGGEPFPATIHLQLTEINPSKDACHIRMVQTLEKEKGRALLIAMLQKLFAAQLGDSDIEKEIKVLEMTDTNEFDLTLSTGWLSKASVKRMVNIGGVTQVETYNIIEKQ